MPDARIISGNFYCNLRNHILPNLTCIQSIIKFYVQAVSYDNPSIRKRCLWRYNWKTCFKVVVNNMDNSKHFANKQCLYHVFKRFGECLKVGVTFIVIFLNTISGNIVSKPSESLKNLLMVQYSLVIVYICTHVS